MKVYDHDGNHVGECDHFIEDWLQAPVLEEGITLNTLASEMVVQIETYETDTWNDRGTRYKVVRLEPNQDPRHLPGWKALSAKPTPASPAPNDPLWGSW